MKYMRTILTIIVFAFMSCVHAQENKKYLDGLTPQEALTYMIDNPDIYILDVREDQWYEGATQFTDNHHIPSSELTKRLKEIPSDRPIIINCGLGWVAPGAYQKIKDSKIPVRQIGYIDGTPMFKEYNNWKKKQ